MPRWFLLDDGPSSGSWNMACDEYLFTKIDRWRAPVLRLYSFEPPAITVGYHQDIERILDIESVARARVDVVRRITGGRALFHKNEITYAVVGKDSDFNEAGTLVGSFERISRALATALRALGIVADVYREVSRGVSSFPAPGGGPSAGNRKGKQRLSSMNTMPIPGSRGEAESPGENQRLTSPCIASTTRFELNVSGRKIAGSAQRRGEGCFIQHGSIFLGRGSEEIEEYLKGRWTDLARFMTTVEAEASKPVDGNSIREMLRRGFEEEFGAEFEPLVLSSGDLAEIEKLADEKRKEFENIHRR